MAVAVRRHAGAVMWGAYLLAPVSVGGLIHGIPLGPLEAFALLATAWLAANGRRVSGGPVVAAMLALSLLVSVSVKGTNGLRARYFANAAAEGPFEPGTEFPRGSYTRIDERLDFTPGTREFPLAFFNDIGRFNFYHRYEPARAKLPFAVDWNGYFLVDGRRREQIVYLLAPHASGQILIDLRPVLTVSDDERTATFELAQGWHRLDVHFSSPYGAPRRFSAGVLDANKQRPFDASMVVTREVPGWQMTLARWIRPVKLAFDAAALAWLALLVTGALRDGMRRVSAKGLAVPPSHALPLLAIVGIVEACRFAWPWAGRLMVMRAGDDPMTYEFYARDILLHGPLMTLGQPLGHGEPFYYQALYPYFIALVHAVFGEGMFGVMLVQRLLVVFVVWKIIEMSTRLAGERVWPVALVWATFFTYWKFAPITADLHNEALFIPLVVAWAASFLAVGRTPTRQGAIRAGLLGGLAALTRSTTLAAWLVAVPACWFAWKGAARRLVLVTAMVMCSIGVFSLITMRNWVVAHTFAATPTGLGVNLLSGNEPPQDITFDFTARAPLYDRFAVNDSTRRVIEFAIQRPVAFALNLGRKSLFALGFYELYAPGWGSSPVYIAGWIAAIFGLAAARRAGHLPRSLVELPALIALTMMAAVVVVYPKDERLIMPYHMLIAPYACVGIDGLLRRARVALLA